MLTSRGVPLLVCDGYEHRFVSTSNDGKRDIYRCCKRACRGRVHVDKLTNETRIVSAHAHSPINEEEQKRRIALHQAGIRYSINCSSKRFKQLQNGDETKNLDATSIELMDIPSTSSTNILDINFLDTISLNGTLMNKGSTEVTSNESSFVSNTELITNMIDQIAKQKNLEPVKQESLILPTFKPVILSMPAPNLARPIVQLKRVETFSAAHRLHSIELSDEENLQIFGKCNNPNSHGHNYTWEAVLKGPVDPRTGMVYNLADLKKEMAVVLEMVDHMNLDKDVAYFRDNNIISTTENLAVFLYTELKNRMRSPELLYEVTVRETDKNIFTFSGSFS